MYGVYGEPEDPVLLEEDLPDIMILVWLIEVEAYGCSAVFEIEG